MKPIEQAFLADILESPDDDAPRLIYADWLEEDGQEERAEFIRVQCKLASLVEPKKGMCGCPYGSCEHCCYRRQFARRKNTLRRRERELLPTNAWDWAGKAFRAACVAGTHYQDAIAFRRGFVEEVTLSLADWQHYGPALVRAAPLRVVRLSDYIPRALRPFTGEDGWFYFFTWARGESAPPPEFRDVLGTSFDTEGNALAVMSRCCLEYARGKNTKTVQA